jgi:hypothetical protein
MTLTGLQAGRGRLDALADEEDDPAAIVTGIVQAHRVLTEKQVADRLSVKPETVAAWRRHGVGLPHVRLPSLGTGVASAIRYREENIRAFISGAIKPPTARDFS